MAQYHFVTVLFMDEKTSSSPFWHTGILLSIFDEEAPEKMMEVKERWGFYGLPPTPSPKLSSSPIHRCIDTAYDRLSKKLNLNLAKNAHGMLCREPIRFLELGEGLHGITFHKSEAIYNQLQKKCQDRLALEHSTIHQIAEKLTLKPKDNWQKNPYEHEAQRIFQTEKDLAKIENRSPRLRPFKLSVFSDGHTCKSDMLEFLQDILAPEEINSLKGLHPSISRYSGETESIILHSTGELSEHTKVSGKKVYYRRDDKECKTGDPVKLYWSAPPQLIRSPIDILCKIGFMEPDDPTIIGNRLKIPTEYVSAIKDVLSQLQRLEWLFRNAVFEPHHAQHQEALLKYIIKCYQSFAQIEAKKPSPTKTGTAGFFSRLLSQPRNAEEARIMRNLKKSKTLINSLYCALVENDVTQDTVPEVESKLPISTNHSPSGFEELAAYLSLKDKKMLCQIINKTYLAPETHSESHRQFAQPR